MTVSTYKGKVRSPRALVSLSSCASCRASHAVPVASVQPLLPAPPQAYVNIRECYEKDGALLPGKKARRDTQPRFKRRRLSQSPGSRGPCTPDACRRPLSRHSPGNLSHAGAIRGAQRTCRGGQRRARQALRGHSKHGGGASLPAAGRIEAPSWRRCVDRAGRVCARACSGGAYARGATDERGADLRSALRRRGGRWRRRMRDTGALLTV